MTVSLHLEADGHASRMLAISPRICISNFVELTELHAGFLKFGIREFCFNRILIMQFSLLHSGHRTCFSTSSWPMLLRCGTGYAVQSSPLAVVDFHSASEPRYVNGSMWSLSVPSLCASLCFFLEPSSNQSRSSRRNSSSLCVRWNN